MAAVCDKDPSGKYMVVNLNRNKKGYVSCDEVNESGEGKLDQYKLGEYIIGAVG